MPVILNSQCIFLFFFFVIILVAVNVNCRKTSFVLMNQRKFKCLFRPACQICETNLNLNKRNSSAPCMFCNGTMSDTEDRELEESFSSILTFRPVLANGASGGTAKSSRRWGDLWDFVLACKSPHESFFCSWIMNSGVRSWVKKFWVGGGGGRCLLLT